VRREKEEEKTRLIYATMARSLPGSFTPPARLPRLAGAARVTNAIMLAISLSKEALPCRLRLREEAAGRHGEKT